VPRRARAGALLLLAHQRRACRGVLCVASCMLTPGPFHQFRACHPRIALLRLGEG
jgi:hypothetical protein